MSTLRSKDRTILLQLLKEARINAGFRQEDLAKKLGVPQSMVSKYEIGERRLDILEIREICSILGLSLTEFARQLEDRLDGGKSEAD